MLSCPFCNMNVDRLDDLGNCQCGYPSNLGSIIIFDWSDYGDGYVGV